MDVVPLSCPVTKVELERIEWCLTQVLAARQLYARKVCAYRPEDMDALIVDVMGTLWCEETSSRTFRWPRGWLQALRERWLPRWWLKRHPVEYETHCVRWGIGYPDFHPSCKGLGMAIPVLRDDSALNPNSVWHERQDEEE